MQTIPDTSTALDASALLGRAAAEGLGGIASLRTLLYLHDHGPTALSILAAHCGRSTASLTGSADRLTKHGYVRREHAANDRRIIRLVLTFEGRNAITRILALP